MGNITITIRAVGPHGNPKLSNDASRLAAEFVEEMRRSGHSIVSATVTHGGEDDVTLGHGFINNYTPPDVAP